MLAERLGVSRTTLRSALGGLEADGLIERRRRAGTFVNRQLLRNSMRLNRLVPFTALIEQCGHVATVDPQVHRVGAPSPDAAEAIGVSTATPCLIVERLLRAGGTPVIAVLDVVPVRRLKVRPEAVVEADTSFEFLVRNGVDPVDYTVAEMVPRVAAGAHVPDALEIPLGTAYLELLETHFSRDHERLAVSRVAVDDRLIRLSILRRD